MSEPQNNEAGVSEAIGQDGSSEPAGKRKMDPGFRRNISIIGGVLVVGAGVVIAATAMFSGGSKQQNQSSDIKVGGSTQQTTDGMTPAMRAKLTRAQSAEAEQAARAGNSYIPPDVLPSAPNEPMLTPEQQNRMHEAEAQANAEAIRQTNERNMMKLNAAQQMLQSTLQRQDVERVAIAKEQREQAAAAAASVGAASVALAADEAAPIADMMEIFGARLMSPVDTDSSTFASAEITTGKLAGAYLIGTVKLAGEGVQFDFSGMRFNGVSYGINAFALDEQTSTNAVQGNLDRKLLQRYVFPVLMAYGGAYATSKAQVATTVTPLSAGTTIGATSSGLAGTVLGGGTGTTNSGLLGALGNSATAATEYGVTRPAPTSAQARAAGVAAAVAMGSNATSKLAAEPVRVSMPNGVSIGVMFREPVVARAGVKSAALKK